MVEKTNLDKKNGRTDNEKSLWHGTSYEKEKAITANGFSKNYAGNTFGMYLKIVSMIRIYHNHKLQTNIWHREEEPKNNHKIPGG